MMRSARLSIFVMLLLAGLCTQAAVAAESTAGSGEGTGAAAVDTAASGSAVGENAATGKPETAALSTIELEEQNIKTPGFSASVGYRISTDFAQEVEPRDYSHTWSLGGAYGFWGHYSIGVSLNLAYQSMGSAIKDDDTSGAFTPSADIGVSRSFQLGYLIGGEHSASAGIGSSVPLTEDDRFAGVKATPSVYGGISSRFFDGVYTLGNSLSYTYLVNTYEYSQASGKINSRDLLGYSMSHSVKIVGPLRLSVGFGLRFSRKLDGSVNYSYNNTQSLSYSWGSLAMALSHTNGGFTDEGDITPWYVDRYHRRVGASVSYRF